MVVFDAMFLMLFLNPKVNNGVGRNPRVDHLVDTLNKTGERIIIPTPVLSELLVGAGDAAPAYLDILNRSRFFRIEPFGTKAAVEAAAALRTAKTKGNKRGAAAEGAPWAKVKFDRQIVAIAKVTGASVVYSDDTDVAALAEEAKIEVRPLDKLPDPPIPPQIEMELAPPESAAPSEVDDA